MTVETQAHQRGLVCRSHGLAVLMTHVNDGAPCSDYLSPNNPAASVVGDASEGEARELEIEARLNAATPGPWEVELDRDEARRDWRSIVSGRKSVVRPDGFTRHSGGESYECYGALISEPDAELIAAAPIDLAYLLASLRSTRAALEEASRERDEAREQMQRVLYGGMSYRFDLVAEAYYRETGRFAPGKDVAAAFGSVEDDRERSAQWQAWLKEKSDAHSAIPSQESEKV